MRELIEVTWEDTDRTEPKIVKEKYWLLFWGMKMEIINGVGVSYSVGICAHYKTGDVTCFLPEQIRLLGTEIKK